MEIKMDEKLSVMALLKRGAKLLFSNFNLAFFLFLCSFPLFCFLIFFELSLQTTISLASQCLSKQLDFEDLSENDMMFQTTVSLTSQMPSRKHNFEKESSENDPIPSLIQTSLLYIFPYSLLDLVTTTMIVAASSIVYTSEEEPMGLLYLVRRSVKTCQNRVRGCVITSLYVLLLSTSVFFGFFSDSTNYLFIASLSREYRSFRTQAAVLFHAVVVLIHGAVFIVLTAKFSKWSAGWNMGLVVSVLEENEDGQGIYGTDALSLSAWYGIG